jgi:hypothetical protein
MVRASLAISLKLATLGVCFHTLVLQYKIWTGLRLGAILSPEEVPPSQWQIVSVIVSTVCKLRVGTEGGDRLFSATFPRPGGWLFSLVITCVVLEFFALVCFVSPFCPSI